MPATIAASSRAPDAPRASASASAAGITGTEGCPLIVVWVSSKSSAWDAAPLMSAASSAEVRLRLGAEQRRLAALAAGRELPAQDDGERLARSRERGAQPVEEAVLGGGDRVGGERREGVGAGELRELARLRTAAVEDMVLRS